MSSLPPSPAGLIKRTGATVAFGAERIRIAVSRAATATGDIPSDNIDLITQKVVATLTETGPEYPRRFYCVT